MQFLKAILDLVFPPKCEICNSLGPDLFCKKCFAQISYLKPSTFVHSIGIYENALKKAIKKFKYGKKTELAKPLGEIMARYIQSNLGRQFIDFFVPVPLYHKRYHERGFNQSELLSHQISIMMGIPTVIGLLYRLRETIPQFDLPKKDRFKNVKGAFAVTAPSFVENRKIALIDDIYTTGSTISECTKVLREAGAQEVHIITLSRAM
ncbi:hypothetical protein A3J90_00700 [candidate division WOR-1 bacterium RIFOXYC2_FULL_37_10]|uniref:Phosphoribosyltransferase domain-containing protein n=1 Tax=candidate division WOR-1 bacterium RIFOXYB2_FULL_37_13 TaxID=1802579 RepID=A0A1F4SUX9_UNCSA|nr:MAG: hypothetical protein A2310_06435 [candidate division WOR-1 bacterium RIFOXYB2_FULL_37_13]OGC37407.1 MAG: hypothetical protein A3J90_00700 [candidate division WOR-1 bacterium RIFOXYC2_FULL_37_10]